MRRRPPRYASASQRWWSSQGRTARQRRTRPSIPSSRAISGWPSLGRCPRLLRDEAPDGAAWTRLSVATWSAATLHDQGTLFGQLDQQVHRNCHNGRADRRYAPAPHCHPRAPATSGNDGRRGDVEARRNLPTRSFPWQRAMTRIRRTSPASILPQPGPPSGRYGVNRLPKRTCRSFDNAGTVLIPRAPNGVNR